MVSQPSLAPCSRAISSARATGSEKLCWTMPLKSVRSSNLNSSLAGSSTNRNVTSSSESSSAKKSATRLASSCFSAGSSPSRSPVSFRTAHSGISAVLALEAQIRSVKCQLPVLSTAAHVGTTVTLRWSSRVGSDAVDAVRGWSGRGPAAQPVRARASQIRTVPRRPRPASARDSAEPAGLLDRCVSARIRRQSATRQGVPRRMALSNLPRPAGKRGIGNPVKRQIDVPLR